MLIHVLLAVDAQQVIGCAVSMRSIMEYASPDCRLRFHVMADGIGAADREALRATVEGAGREASIQLYDVDVSRFTHLMRSKLVSHTTYARLLLDEVLPPEVERCIYVDCDMVVRRDIREAWTFPMHGTTVAAVANGNASDTRHNQRRLGLVEPRYLNAGFVVIDVRRWRERGVAARATAFAESAGDRLVLHDQDALNVALEGDWTELPREWNAGLSISEWLTADSRAVFHYWGAPKPWHADYDGRFGDIFHRYLEMTAYAGYRAWNPFGLGALLARLRRRLPYPPAVLRLLRGYLRATAAA